jgi:hypothetical protein
MGIVGPKRTGCLHWEDQQGGCLANPKLVEEPVIEAVSHGDAITADSRQLP